jgi:DNA-binding NtrC family response regulator/tetratricopeptide (TPR) repeat protein
MARSSLSSHAHPTDRLLGQSSAMHALRLQMRHLATFDTLGNPHVPTVLLLGATGTGKGLIARILHDSGPRAAGPFLEVNCAAIPETLLEAELFGFEAGAFTDARRAKPGLWEAASGGTLFLDEVAELPLPLQSKLLKAIEDKRVRRLGAVTERAVDVKLMAATQAELSTLVPAGRFRADLYHRLSVVLLRIPPLRERREDILGLARHFLAQYGSAHTLAPRQLSAAAEAWLQGYDWPGNVRELSHLMERVTLFSQEGIVAPDLLEELCLPRLSAGDQRQSAPGRDASEAGDERERLVEALRHTGGNVVRAARLLGLSRAAIRHRMGRYGITRPRMAPHPPAPAVGDQAGSLWAAGLSSESTREPARAVASHWEQKPVAVLAIEVTWPAALEPDTPRYEPWTVHARWEHTVLEKVQGFGGVVLQRGPSLLLVAFGVPHTLEQLPHRAVQAAFGIRQLTAEGSATGEQAPQPTVRQAVHWGQVLVDGGASDPTPRVLPIAETLAEPVRWLGQAAPGEILVTAPVRRLIEGWCEVQACEQPVGERQSERAGAHRVLGHRPQRSPLAMHGQRPLSRFVGRVRECALLAELLEQVTRGHGHVVGLVGEAGVGKSRLVYELVHSPQTRNWRVLESAAVSYGTATPYFPFIGLLRRYTHVEARDDLPTIRAKVTEHVLTLDETLQDTIPALLALLDALPEDHPFLTLDPPQRRQRTLDACKRVVLRESQVQPLLLVCEDVHWMDAETQALLETLVESLPRARLLVLVTYRPAYQHGWHSKTYYTQVRLDPLPPGSIGKLLQALLGDDLSLGPLQRLLSERTEGNPFFVEESVRTLVETRVLVGAPGAYRLVQALPTMQVPATVQAVLAARIDRLPPEEKRLLQTAAVVGIEVPLPLLQALAELPEATLHRDLAHLQAAEFLYETRLVPESAYTFKHALTHEVAYNSLPLERRRGLHARLVEALEALAPERVVEQIDRLAHHALRGEVWDKALVYCREAGEKAVARSAYREAVGYFELALSALRHLPEQRDTSEQAIDLRFALCAALRPAGDFGRILGYLREAEFLAVALDDPRRLIQVTSVLSTHYYFMGAYAQAIATGERVLALAIAGGQMVLQAQAHQQLGMAYSAQGDYRRALDCFGQAVAALDGARRRERFGGVFLPAVNARAWLAACQAELGAFAEGRALGEEGLRIAEAAAHPTSRMWAYRGLGRLLLRQGDLSRALPLLEQAMHLCQALDLPGFFPDVAAFLGAAYTLGGRVADAVRLLTQATEHPGAAAMIRTPMLCRLFLGEAQLLAGSLEDAQAIAERALAFAREYQERGYQAYALQLLGQIVVRHDPIESELAEAHYRQALTLTEALGMRPLQAHCHRGLGLLYAMLGQQESARTALSMAITMYRAMDMTFWLPQAETALAQVK